MVLTTVPAAPETTNFDKLMSWKFNTPEEDTESHWATFKSMLHAWKHVGKLPREELRSDGLDLSRTKDMVELLRIPLPVESDSFFSVGSLYDEGPRLIAEERYMLLTFAQTCKLFEEWCEGSQSLEVKFEHLVAYVQHFLTSDYEILVSEVEYRIIYALLEAGVRHTEMQLLFYRREHSCI